MKMLSVILLGVAMLSAGFVGAASAQQHERVAILIPFSVETNYMSQPGYVRYLNHQHTGDWTPFIL
jgi:hypothetical protein